METEIYYQFVELISTISIIIVHTFTCSQASTVFPCELLTLIDTRRKIYSKILYIKHKPMFQACNLLVESLCILFTKHLLAD